MTEIERLERENERLRRAIVEVASQLVDLLAKRYYGATRKMDVR